MKRKMRYRLGEKVVEKEITYIPVRYILAIMITLLETLAIIGVVIALCYFVPYFYLAVWATEIGCVIRIVSSDDTPEYKIPWLLFVLILPIGGFMLYFLFYSRKLKKKYIKRAHDLKKVDWKSDGDLFSGLQATDIRAYNQAKMLCAISESHLFSNTEQEYFPLGEKMHERLLQDLKVAKKFIFMEYFIIEEGVFWNSILEILKEKAAQGVEVKLVYDDIGCMTTLPGNYAKQLRKFGICATPFSRLRGNADSEFNNRNHRKITVIDGLVAYTGGINIADEYINAVEKYGHWKDVGLRLEGEAAWALTRLFLFDYGISVKNFESGNVAEYYPRSDCRESGYLIPFGDGPNPVYKRRVGKSLIREMLANATRYVYITTPYLVIDNELCAALEAAALRGVTVKLVLPHIPDKKLVFGASRSFYPRLTSAGVEIYEYERGFVHAKTYLADGEYAMIGTINLDYRSLVHHFENGVWMYRCACIGDIERDIEETLKQSVRVTREMMKVNAFSRFIRSIVRIFAPLL